MRKTIFVLIDGCSDWVAKNHFGYLEHLAECETMSRYKVLGELPSSSRPMYETLLTGCKALVHGITSNMICRQSKCENIFSLCKKQGLHTAAAAYYWVSELYNRAPFSHTEDRIQLGTEKNIENGIFYYEDTYPDSHVLLDAEYLRQTYCPDFLMVHTMAIDDIGHKFGEKSREQAQCAVKFENVFSVLLSKWMEEGYQVLITSDHGMDMNGTHGGNQEDIRTLPLYIFAPKANIELGDGIISQLQIAPILCELLGISRGKEMVEIAKK